MKQWIFLGLALALACTAITLHNGTEEINDITYEVRAGGGGRALFLESAYHTYLIREDDCQTQGVYTYCLDYMNYSYIDNYPHLFTAEISSTKNCDDCAAYGQSCKGNLSCAGACVHDVCQPENPWCGDGFCDNETSCVADCGEPEPEPEPEEDEPEENVTVSSDENVSQEPAAQNTSQQPVNESQNVTENASEPVQTSSEPEGLQVDPEAEPESMLERINVFTSEDGPNWKAIISAGAVVLLLFILIFIRLHAHQKRGRITVDDLPDDLERDM